MIQGSRRVLCFTVLGFRVVRFWGLGFYGFKL